MLVYVVHVMLARIVLDALSLTVSVVLNAKLDISYHLILAQLVVMFVRNVILLVGAKNVKMDIIWLTSLALKLEFVKHVQLTLIVRHVNSLKLDAHHVSTIII